jgi:hypothetical protein
MGNFYFDHTNGPIALASVPAWNSPLREPVLEWFNCPYCGHVFGSPDNRETVVGCEDCGSHPAVQCPACEEYIDLIFVENFM